MSRQRSRTSVCFFTSIHDASDSRVVNREAVSLAGAGYDVTYFTPFANADPDDIAVVTYGDAGGTDSLPSLPERIQLSATVASRLLDTDFDIYHFHDVELLPFGAVMAVRNDAPVVYDVHENVADILQHREIFPRVLEPLLTPVAANAELVLSKYVDAVVAASPDVAERFTGHDHLTTVANYPWRQWAEETQWSERTRRANTGETRFVYRGLLSEQRGVLTILDAFDRIPERHDVTLVLGGKYASGAIEDTIEQRACTTDRVELVPWMESLADVLAHYRRCDVALHCFHPVPNMADAVHRSNKLFQYMAAGLPTVVPDYGTWPRFVEEVGCGIPVDSEDADVIADALVDLHQDADRRLRLGRNGHRAVLNRFNWASQRRNLLALYDRLTDGPL